MATITQRIALTGDAEIKTAFDALGAAGVAAFKKIQDAVNASKSISALAPTLDDLKVRVQAVAEAGRNFGESFGNASQSVLSTARNFALIGTAVAGAVVGFGLLVKGAGDAAQAIEESAAAAGTSADKLQGLQFAAAQSGIGADKLSTLLARLNNSLGTSQKSALATQQSQQKLTQEFLNGSITATQYQQKQLDLTKSASEQITAFSQLGIATHDSNGQLRDNIDVLKDIADQFQEMPDGAQKSALAIQLFGRAGSQMVGFLDQGSAAIQNLIDTSSKVAPGLTAAQLAIGNKLAAAFDVLGLAATRAKDSVLLAFAPATTALVNGLTNFIAANRSAWESLAAQIAAKVIPIIDSVIAQLNSLGSSTNTDFIVGLIDSFIQFGKDAVAAIGIVISAWNGLVSILQTVADAVNSVFGTSFTGQTLAIVAALGLVTGAFSSIVAIVGAVVAGVGVLVAAFGAVPVAIAAIGFAIGALIVQIPGVQTAFNSLVDGFNGTVQNFKNLFGVIGAEWQLLWNGIVEFASDAVTKILSFIQPVIDAVKSVVSSLSGAGGGSTGQTSDTSDFAGGGHVRGPGTGTSDSILARLSDNEFVQRAAAVKKYGVDFMSALNSMRLPAQAVRSLMNGLNMSGFAAPMTPRYAFAGGGLAIAGGDSGGHRPFNLVIGSETFSNLLAPEAVANAMTRFAVKQQIRSTGRTPTWFK